MKTRDFKVYPIAFFVLIFLVSCEDSNDESLENSLCSPSSEYYFSGVLSDQLECWNEGEYNYQVYHGWGSDIHNNGDTTHYWQPGLNQYPAPDINKTIYLHIESAYDPGECSSEEFHNTFKKGSYDFSPIDESSVNGIEIHYSVNGIYYSTKHGAQDGSFLECTEVAETNVYGINEALKVSWKFRCKLYSSDGSYYKEIEIAKLRTSVLRNVN